MPRWKGKRMQGVGQKPESWRRLERELIPSSGKLRMGLRRPQSIPGVWTLTCRRCRARQRKSVSSSALPYSRNDSHHPGRWRRLTQPLLRAQWERGSCHPTLPSHWELMPQQPPHRQPHQHTEAIPVSWEHRARMCCQKVEQSLVRMPASSFHTPLKTQTPVVPRDTSQCTPKARPQGIVLWLYTLTWLCPEPGDQPGLVGRGGSNTLLIQI